MAFREFMLLNPFDSFECRACATRLKTGLFVRIGCVLTFCAVGVSFFYTFPLMYRLTHSHPDRLTRFFLDFLIPLPVIAFQVSLFFIPVSVYAWYLGKLEKAEPKKV